MCGVNHEVPITDHVVQIPLSGVEGDGALEIFITVRGKILVVVPSLGTPLELDFLYGLCGPKDSDVLKSDEVNVTNL